MQFNSKNPKLPNLKMGKGPEQTFLKRFTDRQYIYEKILNSPIDHRKYKLKTQ
jgi:hypothetical protein